MKRTLSLFFLILAASAPIFSDGFYIDGGISVNVSNYGAQMDRFISNYFDFYGLNRFGFGGSISAGYRLLPGLYLGGTFMYTRDMLRGFGYNINLHSPSLLAGLRWYPLGSRRFLQLALDAGPSWLIFSTDVPGTANRTGAGIGVNTAAAYDFNPSFNGPHWQLAMNVLYSRINGGSVFTPGVSLKISYKNTKKSGAEDDFDTGDMSNAAWIIVPLFTLVSTWIGYNLIPKDNNL